MAHIWNAHLKKPSGMNDLEMPCGERPRRGLLCILYMEKFTACFGVRVKTFSAHVMTVSCPVVHGKRFKLHQMCELTRLVPKNRVKLYEILV